MSKVISMETGKELLLDYDKLHFSELLDAVMNYQSRFDGYDIATTNDIKDGIGLFQAVRDRTVNEELKDFCSTYLKHLHLELNSVQLRKGTNL